MTKNEVEIAAPRLPFHPLVQERFGIDKSQWRVLVDATFPAARTPDAVIMALSYCKARRLDPFKRPVHIVPVWDSAKNAMVETVWPGIAELRTTATRTGSYAGNDPAVFGTMVSRDIGKAKGFAYPESCQITVYRMVDGQRVPFHGPTVWFDETYASAKKDDPTPNAQWSKRPRYMLEKCAEAAALRAAFPEELGGELAAEEIAPYGHDLSAERSASGIYEVNHAPAAEKPKREKRAAPEPEPEPEPEPDPDPEPDPEDYDDQLPHIE